MIVFAPWGSTTVTADARPVAAIVELERSVDRESSLCLEPDRPWRRYLHGLKQPIGSFSGSQIRAVERIWEQLRQQIGARLPLPRTQPMSSGAIQIGWYSDRYTAEIEVLADGRIEWFFRDRITKQVLGTEDAPETRLPAEFLPLLRTAVQ